MKISTLGYSFKQGLKNIRRNKMFSLASIATMTTCIFLFGLLYAVVVNFRYSVEKAEENVAVTVFFKEELSESEIKKIGSEIEKMGQVSNMKFISEEEAWEDFQKKYFEGAEELADGFKNDNPLAGSANYIVYLNDVGQQKELVAAIEDIDGVRQVNKSDQTAELLSNFNMLIGYVSIGIILILLVVAIFLISNTVSMGIAVRKEEIAIMKLIGAKDSFVKAPFVVEGLILGFIGSALPLGLIFAVYNQVLSYVKDNFNVLTNVLVFLPIETVFRTLLPAGLLLGIGIGFIGSFLTIRKHLKV